MIFDDSFFTLRIDENHIVHVQVRGAWTPAIADRYWRALGPFLAASRAALGYAKVLVDRRQTPIMPLPMVMVMRAGLRVHYAQDDVLALVVDSSPLKSQVRQNYAASRIEAFLSHDAALAWLAHR
ncbi:hypothetical protein RN629_16900 [Sphingomonadaceae bacterium jetA1]|jgi:hypothetical protein|uniref:hypothetical protein n=1 Tax=Facivitalis istanbulensis TaxID=3075838 RepID=UPI0034990325